MLLLSRSLLFLNQSGHNHLFVAKICWPTRSSIWSVVVLVATWSYNLLASVGFVAACTAALRLSAAFSGRKHCIIKQDPSGLSATVTDYSSKGTFVSSVAFICEIGLSNERQIRDRPIGLGCSEVLRDGDWIYFGSPEFGTSSPLVQPSVDATRCRVHLSCTCIEHYDSGCRVPSPPRSRRRGHTQALSGEFKTAW